MISKFQPKRLAEYDENSIINEIKRVSSEYFENRAPKIQEFNRYSMIHSATITKRFGSWAKAMEKAGIEYKFQRIDSQNLLEDLNKIKNLSKGLYFTQDFYKKRGGKYSVKTLKKRFGVNDWETLLRQELNLVKISKSIRIIVLKSKNKRTIPLTEEQLFSELNRVWQQLGRRPTYSEFRKLGNVGTKDYERRFGSWTKAIEVISLKFGYFNQTNEKSWVTDELLLAELKEIASKISSAVVTFRDYKKYGGIHSIATFQNHFGSWANALKKIGKHTGPGGPGYVKYSNEELFAELQRIWEKLGRQPMFKEMKQYGNISGVIYQTRFGSWLKAIHAFCLDREKDSGKSENVVINKELPEKEEVIQDNNKILPEETDNTDNTEGVSEKVLIMHTARTPSLRLRFNVLKRDNFKCVKCGRSPSTHPGLVLEIDHKNPYSKGGETVLGNLETLCLDCNRGKSNVF